MKRSATSVWKGGGKDGTGHLTTKSLTLNKTQYSFSSRFENGTGTNPEELVAAAHAGCFNMKLSFVLGNVGFVPDELNTSCEITIEDGKIISSKLFLTAKIKGIDKTVFENAVKDAELSCPISLLLDTIITVEYSLQ